MASKPIPLRENWIETRMREVLEEGDVCRLPGAGKPLPDLDQPYDPLWWGKRLVRRERLSVVPPALEMRRRVDRVLAEVRTLRDERRVRQRLEALNREIARANATTISGPETTVALIDVKAWIERRRQEREMPH